MTALRVIAFFAIYLATAKGIFEFLQLVDMRGWGAFAYTVWGLFFIGLLAGVPLPFFLADSYGATNQGFAADLKKGAKEWVGLCNMTLKYFIGLFVIFLVMYGLSFLFD